MKTGVGDICQRTECSVGTSKDPGMWRGGEKRGGRRGEEKRTDERN